MFMGKRFIAAVVIACSVSAQAFAADGCVVLKSTAEVEQEVVDASGNKTKELVPVTKAVPGVEVIWTVTASNKCKQPSEKVTINLPVPEHMTYVPDSAVGPGSVISYSLDGKAYGTNGQLMVKENGVARPARTDEYRHVRWSFKDSLQPNATAMARFRAVLN
jgi:uncharacterized repeat protein (TIGR01451 family)